MSDAASDARARRLLLAGVVAGVGLAGFGVLRSGAPPSPPADAVAIVDGEPIPRSALSELESALVAERRGRPLDAGERRRLLDRVVDEELLLQRGIALGLARHEPSARRAIVGAVVAAVTADAESKEPSEDELRAAFEASKDRYATPDRVVLEAGFVAAGPSARPEAIAWREASEMAARLRSGAPLAEADAPGDPLTPPLPDGPLTLDEIRQTLGPSAALAAERLAPGEVSDPVRSAAGYVVLRLRERVPGPPATFEAVRDRVRDDALREAGERALARYLAQLRSDADVRLLAPDEPAQ